MCEKPAWHQYQEEVAAYFRDLGADAITNAAVEGARAKHKVDVLVTVAPFGLQEQWLIECKYWKTKVSMLHIVGLIEIVRDTGSTRGIIVTEQGFQAGAHAAAAKTNIELFTFENLKSATQDVLRYNELSEVIAQLDGLIQRCNGVLGEDSATNDTKREELLASLGHAVQLKHQLGEVREGKKATPTEFFTKRFLYFNMTATSYLNAVRGFADAFAKKLAAP